MKPRRFIRFLVVLCAASFTGALLIFFTCVYTSQATVRSVDSETVSRLTGIHSRQPYAPGSVDATGEEAAILAAGLLLDQVTFTAWLPMTIK